MKYRWHIFITGISTIIFFTQFTFKQKQEFDLKASMNRGKEVYIAKCLTCHLQNGEGVEALYPPFAKADYLMADRKRSIQQTLYGVKGEMIVNGKIYNTEMKAINLTNEQASDVLNYIRNSWGNEGSAITPDEVEAARNKKTDSL
jgi:mono/diheme cytochrome c family protein